MSSSFGWKWRGAAFLVLALVLFGVSFGIGARRAEAVGSLPGSLVLGTSTSVPYAGDLDGDGWDDMIIVDEAGGYLNINYGGSLGKFQSVTAFVSGGALKGSNRFYFFSMPLLSIVGGSIDTTQAGKAEYKSDLGIVYWNPVYSRPYFHWRDTSGGGWDSYTYNDGLPFPTTGMGSNFLATMTDVDGDGRGDPAVYQPDNGVVHILLSSANYADTSALTLYTGITLADVFTTADYDNAKTDPNDTTDPYYTRGRDYLDDLVFIRRGTPGSITYLRSYYGYATDTAGLTRVRYPTGYNVVYAGNNAPASGSPVFGTDWDGDGIKDLVWADLVGTTYTWRGYLSGTGWAYSSNLLGYAWGTYDPTTLKITERLTVGHFDVSDFKAEPAANNYSNTGGTLGSWYLPFSSNIANGLSSSEVWQLPYLTSWKYGGAISNWEDGARTCYKMQSGTPVPDSTPMPAATPVSCAWAQTGNDQGWEVPGLSEQAAIKYQPFAGRPFVSLNRMAPNLNYSNALDPRANIIYSGNYFRTLLFPSSKKPDYAIAAPGSIYADYDDSYYATRCYISESSCDGQSPRPQRRTKPAFYVPAAGQPATLLFDRVALKKWLVDNRRGPMNDPRRWYIAKPMDEQLSGEMFHERDQVLVYRDWTRVMAEVRGDILSRYGRRVWPGIQFGAPSIGVPGIGPSNTDGHMEWPQPTPNPSYRIGPGYDNGSETNSAMWEAYMTRFLKRMSREDQAGDDTDFSPDLAAATGSLEDWSTTDAANFRAFYMYNAITTFPNLAMFRKYVASGANTPTPYPTNTPGPTPTGATPTPKPVAFPMGMMDFDPPGGPSLTYNVPTSSYRTGVMDPWLAAYATVLNDVATGMANVQGCWTGSSFVACGKPTFITQYAALSYNSPANGWNTHPACPDCPQGASETTDHDLGRYADLYGNAYIIQRLSKELETKPNVWAWTYWGTVDQPAYYDPINGNPWGSLSNSPDPLIDWQWSSTATNATPVVRAGTPAVVVGVGTPQAPVGHSGGLMPMGYGYLWAAAGYGNVSGTPTPMPTFVPYQYFPNRGIADMKPAGCISSDTWCYDKTGSFDSPAVTPTPLAKPPWLP